MKRRRGGKSPLRAREQIPVRQGRSRSRNS